MKKQPEITEQTRKNIITAFCQLYEHKPIEQIHVKDVIAKAGYNRSTFYEYFSDIYALRSYIENDVIHYIKSGINNNPHTQVDLLHLLSAKEDYLKVLLGPYGGVHFQDQLKSEFTSDKTSPDNSDKWKSYLNEFHISISLSLYRFWLQKKDITLDELSYLIHMLYTGGINSFMNDNCNPLFSNTSESTKSTSPSNHKQTHQKRIHSG